MRFPAAMLPSWSSEAASFLVSHLPASFPQPSGLHAQLEGSYPPSHTVPSVLRALQRPEPSQSSTRPHVTGRPPAGFPDTPPSHSGLSSHALQAFMLLSDTQNHPIQRLRGDAPWKRLHPRRPPGLLPTSLRCLQMTPLNTHYMIPSVNPENNPKGKLWVSVALYRCGKSGRDCLISLSKTRR